MIVDCALYRHGQRVPGSMDPAAACAETFDDADSFVWVGIADPVGEEFAKIADAFSLPALAVEDAMEAHQRPKFEVYGETLFVVIKPVRYVDSDEVVSVGEVQIFIHKRFLVTVRHGEATALADVRHEAETNPELLKHGPPAALHAILDRVVDDYDLVTEGVEQDIQQVEAQVFSGERHDNPAARIFALEREVLEFQRAVAPLLPAVDRLARGRLAEVVPELSPYFRDVHDHLLRTANRIDGFRALLSSALQANLTQITVRQNEDMRRISAWVAIAAIPTMLAGIYGMNFEHMPELRWQYGYPLALGVMATACGLLYRRLRRAGWL
ncbi:Cobalt/magnesium transport protein CorA [Paraconexibacter sp. AEG42_29]|uniref:Cobalt/magnesium transport protein CorA n=1 Tax=Paraconexibacter sp. AEG42_29 TaxID=2997339 RepID=A0AAU7AVD1_9ACTN